MNPGADRSFKIYKIKGFALLRVYAAKSAPLFVSWVQPATRGFPGQNFDFEQWLPGANSILKCV
jgi:hypothetical protein